MNPNQVMVRTSAIFLLLLFQVGWVAAQSAPDSVIVPRARPADDPAAFFTRVELYNEIQYLEGDF